MSRDEEKRTGVAASARQFGDHARQYAVSRAHNEGRTRLTLIERMEPIADETLLDVACGPGAVAFAFAPFVRRTIGCDVALEMLHAARLAARRHGTTNATWMCGDVHRLPLADRCVDLVTSRAAPHHFPDVRLAMREMARVLKRGGRLGVADGTVPDDPEVDAFVNALDVLHDSTTVRNYSAREWRDFFEGAGLRVDWIGEEVLELDEGRSLADWIARSGGSSAIFDEARRMLRAASPAAREFLRVREEADDVRFDLPRVVIVGKRVD